VLEGPVRLAVDLKNTQAKRFKQPINCLNVRALRGAFNSPTVFRVVFDLLYLKNYNVSFNNDKNVLVVEFFNTIDHRAQQSPRNPKKGKKAVTKPAKINQKSTILAQNQANRANQVKNKNITNETIEDVTPRKPIKVSKSTPQQQDDFFAEEKSQVSKKTRERLDKIDKAEQERGRWIEGIDDQEGGSQEGTGTEASDKSFVLQTISGGETRYKGEPMDFDFKNADLENVILFFAKISGLSIVIDPGVTGTITARMYQVPWDQALEYFLKVNGLDMVREGNLLRIGKVDLLAREAQARRKLRESRQMEGELETHTRTLSYAQVGQLAPILTKQLSQRGYILQDTRSNTLIISEVPEKIELLDKLIDTLDTPNPQVSIEARIVETNTNYTKSLGIQWGYGFTADAMYGNQTSLKFPNSVFVGGNQIASTSPFVGPLGGYAVNLPAPGPSSGTVFSLANVANTFRLDMALSAMQAQGKGRIISAPKTTTQNNMEATIQQGKSIPVQTSQNNTIQVRYVPAALELKVTPQITAKGTVIVDVDIKNNAPDFGNLVLGIPPITTQTIKTTIMVDDGGTIVIGGMYRVENSETTDSVPFFSKLPLLGNLFKNSNRRNEQKELLIFITPRIIK
jgi:type IV pilus assembly protein PilQ